METFDVDNLLWAPIGLQDTLKGVSADAVKGFFQIYEINVYLSVPLDTLLSDILEGENVVYAPYFWSKACLLVP